MRILIVGLLDGHAVEAAKIAHENGANVSILESVDEAMANLRKGNGCDIAFVDVRLDIGRFISQLSSERIHINVIACGIDGTSPQAAAKAIALGASEFLPLPPDANLISALLESIAGDNNTVIHKDEAMKKLLAMADTIAPSDANILISGESGTGKEVLSRYIHNNSKRKDGPFIAINCAAISENLLESELFGHEKGAFTGAISRRIGKFEEANGGTLLLDEISEMDLRLQAKLLRAIQEREIDRVGGNTPIKINVRILATSNRDMEQAVNDKIFREDLYFRLNVVNLMLPPLRERPKDIEVLAEFFMRKFEQSYGLDKRPLTQSAIDVLASHPFPGNVRELENTIHRAVIIAQGDKIDDSAIILSGQRIKKESIDPLPTTTASAQSFEQKTIEQVERDHITKTMAHVNGDVIKAAEFLGVSLQILRHKLERYEASKLQTEQA